MLSGRWLHAFKQPSVWFVLGALVLAAHPVLWLIATWTEPAYNSNGWLVFALVAGLFFWSWRSPAVNPHDDRLHALGLLALSTTLRLAGQLLAVNSITALTLVVDVYALALLCGLHKRRNTISPFWLAALFALSLPLERILQRTIGYVLQQVSAAGACQGLSWFNDEVVCQGVRILLAGQDLLVDLPCSGARGLLLLLLAFVVIATVKRPAPAQVVMGFCICVASAVFSNIARIMLLALGLAYPGWFAGISVMASPWHDLIGMVALAVGIIPIVIWATFVKSSIVARTTPLPKLPTVAFSRARYVLPVSLVFCGVAFSILQVPAKPVDVARHSIAPQLPGYLMDQAGIDAPLTQAELDYFQRYGGGAARKFYGGNTLLVVQTSAPLRHLHAPDECLRGGGHRVEYIGMDNRRIPTAIYRSTDPQGLQWRIRVSFVSDGGHQVHSVAAAVWQWLQTPDTTWSQVQRITPWPVTEQQVAEFDAAVLAALDLGEAPRYAASATTAEIHYVTAAP